MIVRFETAVPDDLRAARARAETLLGRYGFVREAGEDGRYVRASRWGTGAGVYPRQVRTTVALGFDGGRVEATLRTDPLRGPVSALDRHVWRGEMDDLRAAIEGAPGPGLDRVRENARAGAVTGATLIAMLLVLGIGGVAIQTGGHGAPIVAALVLALAIPLGLYVVLPLRMPRYLLAETAAPDVSNYPRGDGLR